MAQCFLVTVLLLSEKKKVPYLTWFLHGVFICEHEKGQRLKAVQSLSLVKVNFVQVQIGFYQLSVKM